MISLRCFFCTTRVKIEDPKKLPRGWGSATVTQGQFTFTFVHCPQHKHLKHENIWDVVDQARTPYLRKLLDDLIEAIDKAALATFC